MLHVSGNGIYCDLCGEEVLIINKQIQYFTVNIKQITDGKNINREIEDILDMEICEKCHQKLRDRVYKVSLINDEKRKKHGKKYV